MPERSRGGLIPPFFCSNQSDLAGCLRQYDTLLTGRRGSFNAIVSPGCSAGLGRVFPPP